VRARPSRSTARRDARVVVDGKAADADRRRDVVDRAAERERSQLVEPPDGELLLLARQLADRGAEVGFDDGEQPIERTVEVGQADRRDRLALPFDLDVPGIGLRDVDQLGAERIDEGPDGSEHTVAIHHTVIVCQHRIGAIGRTAGSSPPTTAEERPTTGQQRRRDRGRQEAC
jgi:hypothetical protein